LPPSFYKNGPYKLFIANTGAISVNKSDWLSKYSAAIHNNFYTVHEYARIDDSSNLNIIRNVDLIYEGETIYHIPTHNIYSKQYKAKSEYVLPITEQQKKRITKNILEQNYHVRGERLKILQRAISILGHVNDAATLAEIAGFLSESGTVGTLSNITSIVAIILFPVDQLINLLNAYDSGLRMFCFRSIAYTYTAFAFNDPPPKPSREIIKNKRVVGPGYEGTEIIEKDIAEFKVEWDKTSKSVYREIKKYIESKVMHEKGYRILLKSLLSEDKREFCKKLLFGFEDRVGHTALYTWKRNYRILYPD